MPTFAPSAVETYYERPYSEAETGIDKERFQKYINDASRLFKDYELTSGKVFLDYSLQRTTIVNTEGTVIAQNRKAYRLMLEAVAEADDGTTCPLYEDIFAYSEKDLPTPTELEDKVRDLAIRAEALSKAPMAEAYTGPAILSGKASAVFFHEVLGHRLEGKRRESVNNEISGMLNQRILPASFQLYLDPTLTTYQGKALSGHYLYDDEGVKRAACGLRERRLSPAIPDEPNPRKKNSQEATGTAVRPTTVTESPPIQSHRRNDRTLFRNTTEKPTDRGVKTSRQRIRLLLPHGKRRIYDPRKGQCHQCVQCQSD